MTAGVKNWKNAKQKIKEQSRVVLCSSTTKSSSESRMLSMIKWHALKRNALMAGFKRADQELLAAREQERQRNRSLLCCLIDVTVPGKTRNCLLW